MIIQGNVTSFKRLPSLSKGKDKKQDDNDGLWQLSIEGFGILVRSALVNLCPASGQVVARVFCSWKKGKRPVYFLQEVKPIELRPLV